MTKFETNSQAKEDYFDGMKRKLFTLFFICCVLHGLFAQDASSLIPSDNSTEGNVQNTFMLEIGSAHRADTYLSPVHYSGWTSKVGYEHIRAFHNSPLLWQLDVNLAVDRTNNRVRNAVMWGAQFETRWALLHRWRICNFAELGAGGATTVDAGALYLSRNGNNPVAANASWTVDAAGYASACFRLGRVPVVANYRATLPVIGAMFAPEYAQLYYEIYLGDRKGIFSGAYWGKYFRLDQLVSLNLHVGKNILTVGYGVDILSTKVHDIVSRRIDHTFVLGITTGFLSYTK